MFDTVIRGGRVAVDDELVDCEVAIRDGRIAEFGSGLPAREEMARPWAGI